MNFMETMLTWFIAGAPAVYGGVFFLAVLIATLGWVGFPFQDEPKTKRGWLLWLLAGLVLVNCYALIVGYIYTATTPR
jgi:hypothetical protein